MNNLILEIIPPRPDLEKLKKDLVGRKIAEGANGYRKKDWYWEIKSTTELKNVDIKNTSNNGEDYVLDVYLILQGENTDYNANVKIYYVLRQYDDWTIDMIETQHKYHDVDIEFARTVLNKIKHRLETEDLNPEESFQLTRTYNAIMEKYMQYVNDSINQNAIMERYMQYVNDSINQNAIINKKHKVPQ
jgi:hypothetical protein